jgi:hypothetical protein
VGDGVYPDGLGVATYPDGVPVMHRISFYLSIKTEMYKSRVGFLVEGGNFSLHHCVQNGSGAHPASYPMGTRSSFPGGKVGCDADQSPPSSAEVKNAWICTSTPPIRLHGMVLS